MLKMKCPSCEHEIISSLLTELNHITCPTCKEDVPVKDVIVYSNGFSYDRFQLKTRLNHYKKLLSSAYRDYENLKNNPKADLKSKASHEQLIAILEELMAGARNIYRTKISKEYFVTYQCGLHKGFGLLLDLSTNGACIQSTTHDFLPGKDHGILLSLTVPERPTALTIKGKVSWSKLPGNSPQNHRIGIQFAQIDNNTKASLRKFIEPIST